MHLVQILVPRAEKSGRGFPREDFDRVKQQLASRFDGVTANLQAPAEGLWRQGASSENDEIAIFEVMVEKIDLPDWLARRAELEKRFGRTR